MSKSRYPWWGYVKEIIRRAYRRPESLTECEKEAVRRAVESSGRDTRELVQMVFWDQTHTLAGAALKLYVSYGTAQRYHGEFIKRVAGELGLIKMP